MECAGRAWDGGPMRRWRFGSDWPKRLWISGSSWLLESKAVSRAGPLSRAWHRSPRDDSALRTHFVSWVPWGVNEATNFREVQRLDAAGGALG